MGGSYRIVTAPQATTDLELIFKSIAKDSPQNAARVIERILASIELLGMFPHRTVVRGRHGEGKAPVRSLPVQSWIVFFRVLDDQKVVRILRVRHGAQRPPRNLE